MCVSRLCYLWFLVHGSKAMLYLLTKEGISSEEIIETLWFEAGGSFYGPFVCPTKTFPFVQWWGTFWLCSVEGEIWKLCHKARGQGPAFSISPLGVRHSQGTGTGCPFFHAGFLWGPAPSTTGPGIILKKEILVVHFSAGKWNWNTFLGIRYFSPTQWKLQLYFTHLIGESLGSGCLLGAPQVAHPTGFTGEFI